MFLRTRNHTILLFLLLGIGLPCIILGLLAFRGLKNDEALREKEIRKNQQVLIDSISVELDREMGKIVSLLRESNTSGPGSLEHNLSSITDLLFESTFYIDTNKHIVFPEKNLLYNDDFTRGPAVEEISSDLLPAFIAEFQEGDAGKAAALYRKFQSSGTERTRAQALFALARLRRADSNPKAAITFYRQIQEQCSRTYLPSGLPAAPAALFEEGIINKESGDRDSALSCWLRLLHGLLDRRWRLDRRQYTLFQGKINEEITAIKGLDSLTIQHVSDLALREDTARRRTERLLLFKNAFPALLDQSLPADRGTNDYSLSFRTGEQRFLVLLVSGSGASPGMRTYFGALLNRHMLAENVLPRLIDNHLDTTVTTWKLTDKDGAVLTSSGSSVAGKSTITNSLINRFPPWTLTLYQEEGSLIPLLFSSGRSLYGLVFLVIIIILIVTIIWAVHTFFMTAELAETKTRFVAALSHDLKSPLTSIRQVAEMLRDGRVKPDKRTSYYTLLARQSERLTYLMDNILDATGREIGKRRWYFEMIPPEPFLRECMAACTSSLQAEGFSVDLSIEDDLPEVRIDRHAVQQAMANLIDNARKYSSPGSAIEVRAERSSEWLLISIRDYGRGIDTGTAKRIFRPYYRGPSGAHAGIPGSGLGLSLVKSVMDSHHGRVTVESTPGKGTVFSLEFPLRTKD